MRVFEMLFMFSLIPLLVIPFLPHSWQRRWSSIWVLLLALIGGIHLFAEGWRIHMVPL
jgi:hypothetical protein